MTLKLYWIDAFTSSVFGGNPAAVIPLTEWLDSALMQRIARENGLSETAFFVRTGPARAGLRWFTPETEVDLCGHATLATGHVLFHELGQDLSPFVFDTLSGSLTVERDGRRLVLDFPSRSAEPASAPASLARALGCAPSEVFRTNLLWLCVFPDEETVRSLTPDFKLLDEIVPGRFIVTAPGSNCDFVSRFFAPDAGIAEDPVTGSAHCTLAPYWAGRLGKPELTARQVSARGGELWLSLRGDRVKITGETTLYLQGEINI